MTFGIGYTGAWRKETINKYKEIGAKEVYYPFKFDNNNFNSDKSIKKEFGPRILPWLEEGFKVHIHTEQQGERSYPTPTYLGSDTESYDTVERVKAIIDFMKELEEEEGEVKGEFGIVEVHSTAKSNIPNKAKYEETLIKNLNELSDYAKSRGYEIGIEYGKENTPFKRDVIESIWNKNKHSSPLNSDVKLIFDVELCYQEFDKELRYQDPEMELVKFFKDNIDKIVQIHWNNLTKGGKEYIYHRPLFGVGRIISRKPLEEIAEKAKNKTESNLWECKGALYKYKEDLKFLQNYFREDI